MYKVAIIGAGAIANTHIEAYLAFPQRCQVVAVVDIYPEKARQKVDKYHLDAQVFSDYKELLEGVEFDIASVCTPPFAHAETAIALLNAGKHVLVEKPMAPSLDACDAMIQAANKNQCLLSVVAQNRFRTPMMKLKQVLDSGMMGKILHAQVDSFWWRGNNYYDLWWRGTWEKEGGGCTMNHAVHHIDLFHWMMGMPSEVQAVVTNIAHTNSEVEDFSSSVMRYPDGKVGQLTASLVHHGEDQQLVFQGEFASVGIPWRVRANTAMENGFPQDNQELEERIRDFYEKLPEVSNEGHAGQVENFLDAVDGKGELLIDGVAGRKTIELVMAIYQSGTTGQAVKLPLSPDAPFYTREGVLKHAPRFYEKKKSVENFATEDISFGSDYKEKES